MRLVTIASLGASAVLGLGALFVAKIALPNASAGRAPAAAHEAPGVPVVVAARPLKFGEKLDAGMLAVINVPAAAAPEGAFASIAAALAADHGGAPVVLTPLSQREALLPTKVSGPGERPSVAAEVADGMRAYAVKINDATGVGGHALPGDRVDVVLLRDLTPDGPQRSYISYVVVQNARVLGVDLNADPTSNKPATPNTATLEVSVADSQKLSVASTLGTLSLALRKNGEAEIADATPLRTGDFLSGSARTTSGGGGVVRRSAPRFTGILIVEGASSKRGGGGGRGRIAAPAAPTPPVTGANVQTGAAGSDAIG